MSLLWSDLPLDLLISIRNKLHNADFFSFRLVCSEWHSASPIPNPCQPYIPSINNKSNITRFTLCLYNGSRREHFISLPFSLSSTLSYFNYSNGWLVFINYNNYALYLFDAMSNRKFTFPPLKPMILHYYKKVKPTIHDAYHVYLQKIVVSSSFDAGIAVAGIVEIRNQTNPTTLDRIFIFCRQPYRDCQRMSLLMEESRGIRYIALAGDNRFYALSNDCELYMLDERTPLIRLRRIKLWLPKHIFEPSSENSPPVKRLPFKSYGMKKSEETDLKVYAYCRRSDTFERRYISLKINVAKLHGYSNNIELKSADLVSFHSVCSQWHSASPIPNPCQPYIASFDNKSNITFLTLCHYNGTPREHFISLPFSLSSTLFDIHYSNGWLVFINYDNYTPYLFDAISNHKFTFPPLKPMILRYYKKIKPTVHVCIQKIVVSLSFDAGIAVADIHMVIIKGRAF
ncbi:hypothetical protein IEQ34_021904 [Dendrobium chrysotoxum]|uniref:F-box domain-containing protein n=1 Tax=Dendrobium chrysotoxum TaxID=161865 RepID=A0AAV7FW82_DENCH|nr:hypothetical protein IEQ34_021904 [Dendrobium chrysotoxum]